MRVEELQESQFTLEALGVRWAGVAGTIGVVAWIATAVLARMGDNGTDRFFRSYLVAFMFFLSLGLGALFFVLITHLTRAGWGVALRRVAEVVSMTLVPLALFAVVVFLGRHHLYEWTHLDAVASDELLRHKQPYLNTPFFLGRLIFYFVVWISLALYFLRSSLLQDRSKDPGSTLSRERVAAPGMILFAMTVTFASFDFLMSLYPHWFSTIFGVYFFAGSCLALFSVVTILVSFLQRAGKLSNVVTAEHFHDLGKLMFAFVVFWAYIGFSQYMLIWYAHIPEETQWYLVRQEGPWLGLSLFLLFGHFFVPFLWLISRHPKRRGMALTTAAFWLLFMHWFDLYWLVMPEASPDRLPFHLMDLTCMIGFAGLLFAAVFWGLSRVRLIPTGDPRLRESMELENA